MIGLDDVARDGSLGYFLAKFLLIAYTHLECNSITTITVVKVVKDRGHTPVADPAVATIRREAGLLAVDGHGIIAAAGSAASAAVGIERRVAVGRTRVPLDSRQHTARLAAAGRQVA